MLKLLENSLDPRISALSNSHFLIPNFRSCISLGASFLFYSTDCWLLNRKAGKTITILVSPSSFMGDSKLKLLLPQAPTD